MSYAIVKRKEIYKKVKKQRNVEQSEHQHPLDKPMLTTVIKSFPETAECNDNLFKHDGDLYMHQYIRFMREKSLSVDLRSM